MPASRRWLLLVAVLLQGVLDPGPAVAQASWENMMPTSWPPGRYSCALGSDQGHRRVVLFGGWDGSGPRADTWEFDGTTWSEFRPATSPQARSSLAMAGDGARSRVVLFGGSDGSAGRFSDTWEWNGTNWLRSTPATSPPARSGHAMAFDSLRGRVVLFGGEPDSQSVLSDTWEWDGTNWRRMTPATSPSGRRGHAMAFDSIRGRTVLFGGTAAAGTSVGDTWEWDGTIWHQMTPATSPSKRIGHAMAYDATRGRVVLFAGMDWGSSFLDTWEWDGTNWAEALPASTPARRDSHSMAFDPVNGRVMVYGGYKIWDPFADTWEFVGTGPRINQPPVADAGEPVSVPAGTQVVLDGSASSDPDQDVLTYAWTQVSGPSVTLQGAGTSTARFTPAERGTYLFRLTVDDGNGGVRSADVTVTAQNRPPVAAAGAAVSVPAGTPVELQGSGSSDPDGDALTYAWSHVSGSQVTLSGANTATLHFTPAAPGTHLFRLTVDDGNGGTGSADVTVTVENLPPVARIRVVRGVAGGGRQTLVLSGRDSSDPTPGQTELLTYRWGLTRPAGASAVTSTTVEVTYVATVPGDYAFTLTVTDPGGLTATASQQFHIVNSPPVADAGQPTSFVMPRDGSPFPQELTRQRFELDGRGSVDADGDELSYRWTLRTAPDSSSRTEGDLQGATTPRAVLDLSLATDPATEKFLDAGVYEFTLTVTDSVGQSSSSTVQMRAIDPRNILPAADAGLDQAVTVTALSASPWAIVADLPDPVVPGRTNAFVRLDGRGSVDPNRPALPLAYLWSVASVPAGSTLGSLGSQSSSPIPTFLPDRAGIYAFDLLVTNHRYRSSPDRVNVLVNVRAGNDTPTAVIVVAEGSTGKTGPSPAAFAGYAAGELQPRDGTLAYELKNVFAHAGVAKRQGLVGAHSLTFAPGDVVTLDGRLSRDVGDAFAITYRWTQTAGEPVALAPSRTAPVPSFVAATPGRYAFELEVTDEDGTVGFPASVELQVLQPGSQPPSLSVTATDGVSMGTDVGTGLGEGVRSLRTMQGRTVTLEAHVVDSDVVGGTQLLSTYFSQLSGPTVLLTTSADLATSRLQSKTSFSPTTGGLLAFEVRVLELDLSGVPTGVQDSRVIRVLVDSAENHLPVAQARLPSGGSAFAQYAAVGLDGAASTDPDPGQTQQLRYQWVQSSGPQVVLANPYSEVTTFAAPDLGDDLPREYSFRLFVDDGIHRSEPALVTVSIDPAIARTVQLTLVPGLDLISVGVRPPATGGLFDAAGLTQLTGSSVLVGPDLGESGVGRFRLYQARAGLPAFGIDGNAGYLVSSRTGAGRTSFSGASWSSQELFVQLHRGLNLVGYPRGVPRDETAAKLLERSGATSLVAFDRTTRRFRVCLPGLGGDFPLEPNRGYLLTVAAERLLTLPTGPLAP